MQSSHGNLAAKSRMTPHENNSKRTKMRAEWHPRTPFGDPNGIPRSPLETVGVPGSNWWVRNAEISGFLPHFGSPCRQQNPSKITEILKKTVSDAARRRTRKAGRRKTQKTSISEGAHPHETLRIQAKSKVVHFCRESSLGLILHPILDPF